MSTSKNDENIQRRKDIDFQALCHEGRLLWHSGITKQSLASILFTSHGPPGVPNSLKKDPWHKGGSLDLLYTERKRLLL